MKQDEYSTANQLWNDEATEVQLLNPFWTDVRFYSVINLSSILQIFRRGTIF